MLEPGEVSWREGVCLCNDRNEVDAGRHLSHDLDVQWLQGVASWANEEQTSVHTQVDLVAALWLLLLQHVALVLIVQKFYDWLPAIAVVHVVAKARCVDDRQADLEELLLELCLCDLDLDSFVNLFCMTSLVVGVVLDRSAEKSVDERGLSEARLTSHHDREGSTSLGHDFVALVWQLHKLSVRYLMVSDGHNIRWQCQ